MSKTSKSPRKVLDVALKAAQQSFPAYSHEFSPKKFTQHQLFACLVLKSFLKTDYRGVVEHLKDCPSLIESVGLTKVPHFTTLQKAAKRLLKRKGVDQLIGTTLKLAMGRKKTVELAAICCRCWIRQRIQSSLCARAAFGSHDYPSQRRQTNQETCVRKVSTPNANSIRQKEIWATLAMRNSN